jgi:hypothetical protein
LTAVPPEIAAASVQIRGKSAIDALNGADGLPENGTRSFSIYQVEGNTALVSDFSTWSISPTVIVK